MKQNMITNVIGWGISMVIFVAGSWFTSNRVIDAKIDTAKAEAYTANIEVVQRVSKLEEAVTTIKSDTAETKKDIKTILQILK